MEDLKLVNNTKKRQYEYHIERYRPRIKYKILGSGMISLIDTYVPKALEGKGIASQLVKDILLDIEKKGLKLVPVCPFVAHYLLKHPEWNRIVVF